MREIAAELLTLNYLETSFLMVMNKQGLLTCLVLLLILVPVSTVAWTGRVVKVIDGDSIRIKSQGQVHEVRLYGIDTPEYRQPYSAKARARTAALCRGKRST